MIPAAYRQNAYNALYGAFTFTRVDIPVLYYRRLERILVA